MVENQMQFLDLTVKVLQLLATTIGLLIIYFNIARKIGTWEQVQKGLTEQIREMKDTIKEAQEKIGTLSERVYELFGQLKK